MFTPGLIRRFNNDLFWPVAPHRLQLLDVIHCYLNAVPDRVNPYGVGSVLALYLQHDCSLIHQLCEFSVVRTE